MPSSSSSGVGGTTVNGVTRFSGLASGIDVDSLVKKMMNADSGTLNKLKQQNQIDKWKQEQYRTIITDVQAFSDKYLDLASPDSILSQSNFQQYTVSSDNPAVSATASGNAAKGNHTISVSQLATAAAQTSKKGITKEVAGSSLPDYASLKGTSFTIQLDGTSRTVTFASAYNGTTPQDGVKYIQDAINEAIGKTTTTGSDGKPSEITKVTVSTDDKGKLIVVPTDNSGVGSIAISDAAAGGAFRALGFTNDSNLSNRINTSETLEKIAGKLKLPFTFDFASGEVDFTINGKKFSFDKREALSNVMDTINKDTTARVTMRYDQNADQLLITANSTGAGNTLVIGDDRGTFAKTLLTSSIPGKDAQVVLDGQRLTRSSNSITQDGVTYNLNKEITEKASINVAQNVEGIETKITNFVTAYNTLIKELNDKISESSNRDYPPLTDAQQASMSETQITNWNKKAMTGLLAHDPMLQNLLYNMRNALTSSVAGQSGTFAKLGITTGTYTEKGQLHIDKTKLKQGITNDPQAVMKLFTQQSSSFPGSVTVRSLSGSERKIRTMEEGLAYKLYDIIQDNIGTLRDANGNKGVLLQKAGMMGDTSSTSNILSKEMETLANKIKAEQKRLANEENRYYKQFTNMENALQKLSSQSSIIASFGKS